MKLNELLTAIKKKTSLLQDCEISGLALDSRKVKSGDLFFAYRGEKDDGCKYVDDAIKNGAIAILFDSNDKNICHKHKNVSAIFIDNLQQKIGIIAAKFYNFPSRELDVIGITGTNGKTSISQFIATVLQNLHFSCGIIGTLGNGFPENLASTKNTTPDAITLHQQFLDFKNAGAKAIAIEVSSHALAQGRISGFKFKTAVFTNLTRDHLDYHANMENYYLTKKQLFLLDGLENAVINLDDEYGQRLVQELQIEKPELKIFSYSINNDDNSFISVNNIKLNTSGLSAEITINNSKNQNVSPNSNCKGTACRTLEIQDTKGILLHANLIGKFNLSNLLAVLTVLLLENIDLDVALQEIKKLKPIPGRMQTFGGNKKPLVVVDFAHTPDALEKALSALREHCQGALWCVFGCGGDRDSGKRPIMGQIAERLSDNIIITDDNPRSEDPKKIVDDILKGLLCPWAVEIEHDRRVAITHAVDCAQVGDIILIAGKGHENYQIIGNEKFPFSDIEIVKELLA